MKLGRTAGLPLAGVFALALTARLVFLLVVDQPLLFQHQYTYFASALRIAEHPHPWSYIFTSDDWRTWDGRWTIAPLYYLFAASVFKLLGPHLVSLQLLQCVLDSLVAVLVALLGRRVAGGLGTLAGVAYAVFWPAFEMPSWTMTENIHTPLLVGAVVLLCGDDRAETVANRRALAGGVLLGLSALARSVSSAFLGLVVLHRLARDGWRKGAASAGLVVLGGALTIGPWLIRNLAIGQPPMVETAAYENIWWANRFGDKQRFAQEQEIMNAQPSPEAQRTLALHFAIASVRERPRLFFGKIRDNFWHFLRPDWLDSLLRVERPGPAWQYALGIVLEDLLLFAMLPFFLVFLVAGPRGPTRHLILLWTAYYLLMIVVVFHNELRYRSAIVPFAFAGAASGIAVVRGSLGRRRGLALVTFLFGLGLGFVIARPYLITAGRAISAARAQAPAQAAIARGDLESAARTVEGAIARDPKSSRPWNWYGEHLVRAGFVAEAIPAFQRAATTRRPGGPYIPTLVMPRLLRETGRTAEFARAVRDADTFSWSLDPWYSLEIAWAALPPPRVDEVVLGQGQADYGAIRGFFHPRGGDPRLTRSFRAWNQYKAPGQQPPPGPHRWSRHRAELRILPTRAAPAYQVTLHMGSPFPSPLASPQIAIRVQDDPPIPFTLDREIRPYTIRASARDGETIRIRLDAPTWCVPGEPAEQGVRVDRLTVTPLE